MSPEAARAAQAAGGWMPLLGGAGGRGGPGLWLRGQSGSRVCRTLVSEPGAGCGPCESRYERGQRSALRTLLIRQRWRVLILARGISEPLGAPWKCSYL